MLFCFDTFHQNVLVLYFWVVINKNVIGIKTGNFICDTKKTGIEHLLLV